MHKSYVKRKFHTKNVKTVIESNYDPILTVAYPITPHRKTAPIPGTLVLGKFIDQRMIKRFSIYTMEELKLYPLDRVQMKAFYEETMQEKDFFFRALIATLKYQNLFVLAYVRPNSVPLFEPTQG